MAWLTAGLAAAGALKGTLDAVANRRQAEQHDKFRKAAIQNSPWTGMADPGAAQVGETSNLGGAIGGGLQGAMVGSLFGGGGAKPPTPTPGAAPQVANQMSFANPAQAPQQSNMDPLKNPASWQALASLGR